MRRHRAPRFYHKPGYGGDDASKHPHFCHHVCCCNPSPLEISKTGAGVDVRNAQRVRSLPPPPPRPPRQVPVRPGLLTHAWVRPSPTAIQRRLLRGLETAMRLGHHPRGRGLAGKGGRPGGRRALPTPSPGGGGRSAAGGCTERDDPTESWRPQRRLRFKCTGVGGTAHHLNPVLWSFPGRGRGWLGALDRP